MKTPIKDDTERELRDFIAHYASSWYDASPSRLRECLLAEAVFVCQVTTNTFGNSVDLMIKFINDMDPAPEEGRVLEIESLFVEPGGDFACASLLMRGLVLHDFTKLPVAEHLHLVRTQEGWRILHIFATPRQGEPMEEVRAAAAASP